MTSDCNPFPDEHLTSSITLTGTSGGGAVSPDANGNISLSGTNVSVIGDPSSHTLNFSVASVNSNIKLTGTSGGAVSPNAGGNINLTGNNVSITGNPLTNTLNFSVEAANSPITLTGTSGGAVSPSADGNINLTSDDNVSITGDPLTNTLNFSITNFPSQIDWVAVTSSNIEMSPDTGYIDFFPGNTVYTLPTVAAFGTVLLIVTGQASGSGDRWTIRQNPNQQMTIGGRSTTSGVTGSATAQNSGDAIYFVCSEANTRWLAISSVGNIAMV